MKKRLFVLSCFLIIVFCTSLYAGNKTTPERKLWNKAVTAIKKGLPKTAIKALDEIYIDSIKEKNYAEALKALALKIVLESNIKGNKPEIKVVMMKDEISKADPEMKPMMNILLAQWYWQYYCRNRYRFLNRSQTVDLNEKDFTTWDLPKLFNEISGIYKEILKDEKKLKKMKLSQFNGILDRGNLPDSVLPTLYDFAVHKAIIFYSSPEQVGVFPQDEYVIKADSDAFGDVEKFILYKPETTDVSSPKLEVIKLYQKIIRFHSSDENKDAFVDADLSRLNYVYNHSSGDEKSEILKKRVIEITKKYSKSQMSALAFFYWAEQEYNAGNLKNAYKIAKEGSELHPGSLGALKCAAMINNITAKSLELKIERMAIPGKSSKVLVQYKNIDSITFRIYKDDWREYMKSDKSINYPTCVDMEKMLAGTPVKQFTARLKNSDDYKIKKELIDLPALSPGLYRIFASNRQNFETAGNCIQQTYLWSSNIVIVSRQVNGVLRGIVSNALTGEPVNNATVNLYTLRDYSVKKYEIAATEKTDENGVFSFNADDRNNYYYLRLQADDNAGSIFCDPSDIYSSTPQEVKPYRSVVFFTDRAIYRPGQMIHFKGIIVDIDSLKQNYKVVPNEKVNIAFKDVNSQEIQKLSLTSNDFGSINGVFTAPSDRLTGLMTIESSNPFGNCQVRVEEYKRPKFTAELKMPDKAYRLNDKVIVTGEALSYTGAPVDGAKVSYRVVREVRIPFWWFHFFDSGISGFSANSREISDGTVKTDETGKFSIEFTAIPDNSISKDAFPVFSYRIFADVTDNTGETRSDDKSISIGYTSMEASLDIDSLLQSTEKPVRINIETKTLDGVSLKSSGTVEICSLKQPDNPFREGLEKNVQINEKDKCETSDWSRWPIDRAIYKTGFDTDDKGSAYIYVRLPAGAFRATLTSKDMYGETVKSMLSIAVCDMKSEKFSIKVPSYYAVKTQNVNVGETFNAVWGTGYERGRAYIELYKDGRLLKQYWTSPGRTQNEINVPVDEKLRGGFTVLSSFVKENKLYTNRTDVIVPWSDKRFEFSIETFRSKLEPGREETWTFKVKGPGAEKRAAELVATLYDESLDAFTSHFWQTLEGFFGYNSTYFTEHFSNSEQSFSNMFYDWYAKTASPEIRYANFNKDIVSVLYGYGFLRGESTGAQRTMTNTTDYNQDDATSGAPPPEPKCAKPDCEASPKDSGKDESGELSTGGSKGKPKKANGGSDKFKDVKARKNLNETAFFMPTLLSDKNGIVTINFRMPEALTKWHFMALAHGKLMESGILDARAVTQKDLMVQPNPPRFLRTGDTLYFTVKVTNMRDKEIKGKVALLFTDIEGVNNIDKKLGNKNPEKDVIIPPKQSVGVSFPISVADNITAVRFKAAAIAENLKDGEEGIIPVLSNRIAVNESIPLWIKGPGKKSFLFRKLLDSKDFGSIKNCNYTVQVASNPSWYAVLALPYLMEFPHECSEQVFNRLYANMLAMTVANSNPKIKEILNEWKNNSPQSLLSGLEKNEQLKTVFLMNTPWVLDAKSETESKRNIGILFDDSMMNKEISSAYSKLESMQLNDGSWSWFPGGYPDTFITLYIITGFGRLKNLNVPNLDFTCAVKALAYLDNWIVKEYKEIKKHKLQKNNNLTSMIALYLYGRSFYLNEKPIAPASKEALDYFIAQAKKNWLKLDSRMSQGHIALALKRFGDNKTPVDIMNSIKERSENNEELGMFWSENEDSWWWYRAPIETQALMIEAFDEVMKDDVSVEACKIWLLKQKQTQDWKTTKATADSVYALIRRGQNLLNNNTPITLSLGGEVKKPEKIEAGTGFYEVRFSGNEIKPQLGEIELQKADSGIAWGGAYWQYLEDISKVTPSEKTPLYLKKTVFVERQTKKGPLIEPVVKDSTLLQPGDQIRIRIELRADRNMEYVHMRDDRGSGLEPVNVLSGYKYQDGLRYYESTKDTSTHFYIDYLPKGTYVFEYPLRIVHRGKYQNGLSHIECMYAPEFSSHSESFELEVK